MSGAAYPTGSHAYPWSIVAADFSGDGIPDVVTANSGSSNVTLSFADGSGGFNTVGTFASGGDDPRSVTVGNFNADGKTDLAVANYGSNNVGVLLGNGAGGIASATAFASGGDSPYSVTVGDFNADGKTDVAVANYGSYNVGVLLGNGAGGFAAATTFASGGNYPRSATVGDFNADGKTDLVVANYNSDKVGVLLNAGMHRAGVREFDSPGAFRFGVQMRRYGAGQLVEGTANAFDGLGRLEVAGQTYAPTAVDDFLIDDGRTMLTQAVVIAQLYVSREITLPSTGDEDFARTLDVFSNPTDNAITTSVRMVGNLGSDAATTVWNTADGDTEIEPTDQWIGTDDFDGTGTPAIIHYVHGSAGLQPTSVVRTGDNVEWTYSLTVPGGQTVRLAHFTILADTRAAAEAAAANLVTPSGFDGEAAAYLASDELSSIANFAFDATPPVVTVAVLITNDTAPATRRATAA